MIDVVVVLAIGVLLAAAGTDLLYATIPNVFSIALVALFVVAALVAGVDGPHWLMALACGLGVLAVGFGLFAFNVIGGGDAKLLAATALWAGWPGLIDLLLIMSLAGAAITLPAAFGKEQFAFARLRLRQALGPRFASLSTGRSIDVAAAQPADAMIPYGIAIAFAGAVTIATSSVWKLSFLH